MEVAMAILVTLAFVCAAALSSWLAVVVVEAF
jgi:hypothetical protein